MLFDRSLPAAGVCLLAREDQLPDVVEASLPGAYACAEDGGGEGWFPSNWNLL